MVTDKKLVNVYLPADLYQALIAYQQQQKCDSTQAAVVEVLAQFLLNGDEVRRYATVEQLETLEAKVTRLSEQVTQLSQALANSTPTSSARTVSASDNNSTNSAYLAQQPLAFDSLNFEEEEDEPYEILYSFLEPESPPPNTQP